MHTFEHIQIAKTTINCFTTGHVVMLFINVETNKITNSETTANNALITRHTTHLQIVRFHCNTNKEVNRTYHAGGWSFRTFQCKIENQYSLRCHRNLSSIPTPIYPPAPHLPSSLPKIITVDCRHMLVPCMCTDVLALVILALLFRFCLRRVAADVNSNL